MEKAKTWKKQARLDYFLISEEPFEIADDCNTVSGYRTGHSAITLQLKLNKNKRGRSYWKFNNSLLRDEDYIKLVMQSIKEVTEQLIKEVTDTYKIHNKQQNEENLGTNNDNNNNAESAH